MRPNHVIITPLLDDMTRPPMLPEDNSMITYLARKIKNGLTISIIGVIVVLILYTLIYQIYPYASYISGVVLVILLTPIVAYPLGYIITQYSKNLEFKHQELLRNNEIKNRLIYILGHDIKSPLINIQEILRLISNKHIGQEEFQKLCLDLYQDVDRTLTLTNNLINWINVQQEGFSPEDVSFNVSDILKESLDLYAPIADRKEISLKMITGEDIFVRSDPEMWKIILRNLISNAIKFTKAGGYVHAGVKIENGKVLSWISDNGIGIKSQKIPGIFNQGFNKSQPGTLSEKGTGLGLNLVKNIADKLGGQVSLESKIGAGTTFYFSLPQTH